MIARCARCQGTFTTDRFGVQTCPHCGSEILLADPGQGAAAAPPSPPPPAAPPAAPGEPAWGAPPPMPQPGSFGQQPPPPSWPPPPPAGYGPPPGPPPPYGPPPYGPPGGYPPPGPYGYGPPAAQPELAAPFAERSTRGFLASYLETLKLVATQPAEFFRRVRVDQPGTAILFGVLASTVGSAFASLYAFLQNKLMLQGENPFAQSLSSLPSDAPAWMRQMMEWAQRQAEQAGSVAGLVQNLALAPVSAIISIYLSAGLFHLVLLVLKGAPRRFNATLTTVAYAHGLMLLAVVPLCGGAVAMVWMLVVLIIGLGEAQRCGAGKAAAAVFAPVVLACLCACLVGVAAGVLFAKTLGAAGGGANL